jgi:catabolite regulation protein CreA
MRGLSAACTAVSDGSVACSAAALDGAAVALAEELSRPYGNSATRERRRVVFKYTRLPYTHKSYNQLLRYKVYYKRLSTTPIIIKYMLLILVSCV